MLPATSEKAAGNMDAALADVLTRKTAPSAVQARADLYRGGRNAAAFPLLEQPARLRYGVHDWSSYAASYHPRHILVNKPDDQGSRWQSGLNNQMQYLTLKLERPAVVHTITFGKFHRVHVCNLKEFKVFGGPRADGSMLELLHSGLRNDTESETFALRWRAGDVILPVQYLKIVPLLAWGANFNFSVWFVELKGVARREVVDMVYWDYINYRETEALRLVLKHFRQRNLRGAFAQLQEHTQVQLEAPLLTALHRALVEYGSSAAAEELVELAASQGVFAEFLQQCEYTPVWRRISNPDGPHPAMRGGHQMCLDADSGKLYLYGGWDGSKDLSDFWEFDQTTQRWTCLSPATDAERGPRPRSCHKICLNSATRQLYLLGRYVDQESRGTADLKNDFWCYDLAKAQWRLVSPDVAQDGGPELIYDHQMVVDSVKQHLYVFGGRTTRADAPDASASSAQSLYSGLYRYDIARNTWTLLRADAAPDEWGIQLRSRIGHSMLLNPHTRELYIFAGQRNKDYLSDFYVYELDTGATHEVTPDYSKQGGPDAGFTQRATIDPDLGEFYVLSGLMREKNTTVETVKNTFWVYSIAHNRWTNVYQNENRSADYWAEMADREPCPRFAHQLVYDPRSKLQFLFGGNPGEVGNPNLRLDDFWELRLVHPSTADVLRHIRFAIRRQHFRELCAAAQPAEALEYLHTAVSAVVEHDRPAEARQFRRLTRFLFEPASRSGGLSRASSAAELNSGSYNHCGSSPGGATAGSSSAVAGPNGAPDNVPVDGPADSAGEPEPSEAVHAQRTALFEAILEFFPCAMKEPKRSLVDLIPLE